MYILSSSLPAGDAQTLREACAASRLDLRAADDGIGDDLLAVFVADGAECPVDLASVRRLGVYGVLLTSTVTAAATMSALRSGYSFVLPSPLGLARATSFLRYLSAVGAPPLTQVLTLDAAGVLSTPSRSVRLDPGQAGVLRLLGSRSGRIVSRDAVAAESLGADPLTTIAQLRERLADIGSGAQILKVPHMGFRLVGLVHAEPTGTADRVQLPVLQ